MREGIIKPQFAEKFFRIDFEASPMPVLCLYPVPEQASLQDLRFEVAGLEQHPRFIPWPSLANLPRVKLKAPLICQIFNWSEMVEWEGVRLADLLDYLKVETHPEGYYGVYSRDGIYFESLSRDEARDPNVLLAFGLNGGPLPEAHGGPLRLVVPFLQGYKSVKWVGGVRAFRHDPIGIKRLLGQSPTGRLNDAWRGKYGITPPKGKAGDPPPVVVSAPVPATDRPSPQPAPQIVQATLGSAGKVPASARRTGTLKEIIVILRPGKKLETRQALESVGIFAYTTYPVLGRSRQRGLKFSSSTTKNEVAIKFLPKELFSIMLDASRVDAAIAAIIKANRTGKGEYGDGKIFVLDLDDAIRVTTDERGGAAL